MHPFTPNLAEVSDAELQKNHSEIMKKINMAYRMGNASLIDQLQMILDDYTSELNRRQQKQLEEILSKNNKFSNIIDIK
jgi:predicted transcriptional regulator of viral defense system